MYVQLKMLKIKVKKNYINFFQTSEFGSCFVYRIICKSNPAAVDSFEDALFPIFQEILQQEVQGELSFYHSTQVNIISIQSHGSF